MSSSSVSDNQLNLYLLLQSKAQNRKKKISIYFFSYCVISRTLWYNGYFPYFFYYSRYTPISLFVLSLLLNEYNFYCECYKYDLLDLWNGVYYNRINSNYTYKA